MEWKTSTQAHLRCSFSCSLGREFSAEVNDLTDVVVGVSGAAPDDGEPILFPVALCGISGAPSFR
jgi:hypothetical protein